MWQTICIKKGRYIIQIPSDLRWHWNEKKKKEDIPREKICLPLHSFTEIIVWKIYTFKNAYRSCGAPLPFNYEIQMLVYTCSATCRLWLVDSDAWKMSKIKCKQQDETERMGQIKTLHSHSRRTQMRHDIFKARSMHKITAQNSVHTNKTEKSKCMQLFAGPVKFQFPCLYFVKITKNDRRKQGNEGGKQNGQEGMK